jgi:hypothetical protein
MWGFVKIMAFVLRDREILRELIPIQIQDVAAWCLRKQRGFFDTPSLL